MEYKKILFGAVLLLLGACNNYGLVDKLENPGGSLDAQPCTNCRIFISSIVSTGAVNGIAGADAICASDSNKPTQATYKAILVDGTTRRACTTANCTNPAENINWVLHPNTAYVQADGTTAIFTTNSAGIFNFQSDTASNGINATLTAVWTGLNNNWTDTATYNCTSWTSSSNGDSGFTGQSNSTSQGLIAFSTNGCDTTAPFYCAEQ